MKIKLKVTKIIYVLIEFVLQINKYEKNYNINTCLQ